MAARAPPPAPTTSAKTLASKAPATATAVSPAPRPPWTRPPWIPSPGRATSAPRQLSNLLLVPYSLSLRNKNNTLP
jgi:hypothetical protein